MHAYRIHSTSGDDLGILRRPTPDLKPGDTLVLNDGRKALVTDRLERSPGRLAALLVVITSPLVP
ncbi:MAG TPA: hypothetical protein VF232_01785 [Gaiellaceae bacterium]